MLAFPFSTLQTFDPIGLDELSVVKLLDRMDKKFTFKVNELSEILRASAVHYRLLVVEGNYFTQYETRYFDTDDFEMYTKHHNRHLNRHKVRFRTYLDSGLHFFEVKFKTNKGRTIKKRVLRPLSDYSIKQEAEALLLKRTPYQETQLKEAIRVYYNRITLVNKNLKERITIDFDLRYSLNGLTKAFPNMIIAEVKQFRSDVSPFIELMKQKRIKDISISKYCLGVASLATSVKTNNFKMKLNYVNKLCNTSA